MPARLSDYFTPTEIMLVSRAWVVSTVERVDGASDAQRARWIDDLVAFQPPRRNGMRNNLIFWIGTLGAAMLADAIGAPAWLGFALALGGFVYVARVLAVRTLCWRLAQLRRQSGGRDPEDPHFA